MRAQAFGPVFSADEIAAMRQIYHETVERMRAESHPALQHEIALAIVRTAGVRADEEIPMARVIAARQVAPALFQPDAIIAPTEPGSRMAQGPEHGLARAVDKVSGAPGNETAA
jgi:hypothetical protein